MYVAPSSTTRSPSRNSRGAAGESSPNARQGAAVNRSAPTSHGESRKIQGDCIIEITKASMSSFFFVPKFGLGTHGLRESASLRRRQSLQGPLPTRRLGTRSYEAPPRNQDKANLIGL